MNNGARSLMAESGTARRVVQFPWCMFDSCRAPSYILVLMVALAGCSYEKEKPEFMPGQIVQILVASNLLPVYGQVTFVSCGDSRKGCVYWVRWPNGDTFVMKRFEIKSLEG